MENTTSRSTFPHGNDCEVIFLKRGDNKNARVDIWQIQVQENTFDFQMMQMKRNSQGPWVFGSFYKEGKRRRLWTFRDDVRVVDDGFRGDVYTYVFEDRTYALYVRKGTLEYLVPFVQMLENPKFDPDDENDIDILYSHYALMQEIAKQAGLILAEDVKEVL